MKIHLHLHSHSRTAKSRYTQPEPGQASGCRWCTSACGVVSEGTVCPCDHIGRCAAGTRMLVVVLSRVCFLWCVKSITIMMVLLDTDGNKAPAPAGVTTPTGWRAGGKGVRSPVYREPRRRLREGKPGCEGRVAAEGTHSPGTVRHSQEGSCVSELEGKHTNLAPPPLRHRPCARCHGLRRLQSASHLESLMWTVHGSAGGR